MTSVTFYNRYAIPAGTRIARLADCASRRRAGWTPWTTVPFWRASTV